MTSTVMHKGPRRARGRPGAEANMGSTGTSVERLQFKPCTRNPSVHRAGRGRREGNVRLHCSTCATVPAQLLHNEYLMSHKSRICSQEMSMAPQQRSAAPRSNSGAHACCLKSICENRRNGLSVPARRSASTPTVIISDWKASVRKSKCRFGDAESGCQRVTSRSAHLRPNS